MNKQQLFQALRDANIPFEPDAPSAPLVSMKAGGPIWALCRPESEEELSRTLAAAHQLGAPVLVIGWGANLLVRDGGFHGVGVLLGQSFTAFDGVKKDEQRPFSSPDGFWRVGAGVSLRRVVERAVKEGREKCAFLGGIPGTVGGAIVMNAGTDLGEMGSLVRSVRIMLQDGSIEERPGASLNFRYRHSDLPPGAVILGAILDPGEASENLEKFQDLMKTRAEKRRRSQPVQFPTAGSTFTNPKPDFAGRLIEACCLKGRQVGGAQISNLHANFIINPERKASCRDILDLIEIVQRCVFEKFAVLLQLEVRVVGQDNADDTQS
jgi:UDP-N-acetylmuramate dehydrogenase